jgi:HSP20 family molecular chaperone IbpA
MIINQFDRLLNDWFADDAYQNWTEGRKTRTATSNHKQVVVDINEDILRIGLAVPGQTKETLEITIEQNFIKVKSIEKETDDKIWNAIALPVDELLNIGTNWDLSATLATVKDGILHISLPKIEEKKPKKVSIKVG